MINIEIDSRYSLIVQHALLFLMVFIGLWLSNQRNQPSEWMSERVNEQAQATKPMRVYYFIYISCCTANWWSCTSGTEATCAKWTLVRRMPFAGLNVPWRIRIRLFPTKWQPNGNNNHRPNAIALCLHFVMRLILSMCNFLLSIVAFFFAMSCDYTRIRLLFTVSFHLLTRLTRKHVSSPHLRDTLTFNGPLSICYIRLPFLFLFLYFSLFFSLWNVHSHNDFYLLFVCSLIDGSIALELNQHTHIHIETPHT